MGVWDAPLAAIREVQMAEKLTYEEYEERLLMDDGLDPLLRATLEGKLTGIATMTPAGWRLRGIHTNLMFADADAGSNLSRTLHDLGMLFDAHSPHDRYQNFADLMGVSTATVDRWVKTNKVPQYAMAYLELALVLQAAQGPVQAPRRGSVAQNHSLKPQR
jgi:hypothetical protein